MNNYLDASVILSFFVEDPNSERAAELIAGSRDALVVSDWAALEVSNVAARLMRIGDLSAKVGRRVLADFDSWRARFAVQAETTGADVALAAHFVRRSDVAVRAADAVHIAIVQRLGALLLTFDAKMAKAAGKLGVASAS